MISYIRTDSKTHYNSVTGRVEEVAVDNRTMEQKEYEADQLAKEILKLTNSGSPFTPVCLDQNGKLTSFQEAVAKTTLPPENSDSD